MIDAVADGVQQIVTEGAANFGSWVPSIGVVEAPYVWRDATHLQEAMGGPIGEQFNETLVKARGMRILGDGRGMGRAPHTDELRKKLYFALKQNVVDGRENPLPTIKSGKFDEVQKYLVLSGDVITPRLVVERGVPAGPQADDRKVIADAVRAEIAWQDDELQKQERTLVDTFKASGMT